MVETLVKSENSNLDSGILVRSIIKLIKQDILDRFLKTGVLSEDDQEFCDEVNWYPIDELELKEEYIEKLKGIEKGPHSAISVDELDKLMDLK